MPHIGIGVGIPGFAPIGSSDIILAAGQFLTPDTWTRTGGRFSIIESERALAADEGDMTCKDGRQVSGIVKAATNLPPESVDDWNNNGGGTTITDNGDGSWRVQMPNAGGTYLAHDLTTIASGAHTFAFEWRQTPGESSPGTATVQSRIGVSTFKQSYMPATSPPADWTLVTGTATEDGLADNLVILDTGGVDIEIRHPRFVTGSDVPAGFPFGSAASTAYGDDTATTTAPAWPGAGRTLIVAKKDFATGVISSADSAAPTSGNYVLDGSTDGNAEYLSWVSNEVLTAQQIVDASSALEAILAKPAGLCSFYVIVDGDPVYVNGVPITT